MGSHRAALAAAAMLLAVLPAAGSGQLVPGAPTTNWDLAQNEYRLNVLRDYTALMAEWRAALNGGDRCGRPSPG